MDVSLPRRRFYLEIDQPEPFIDLAKAALYIAQEEYLDLDVDEYLNALDTMAAEVGDRLPPERYPLRVIQTINHYLYKDLGFQGNTENYYDPRNSFLNQVIDRRTGIPITLSLVYLEVARRLDFPMVGVGMPGHFLIRPDFEDAGIYVDAFHNGEVMFPQDCANLLARLYQQPVERIAPYLPTVGNKQFLLRMLANLKAIYLMQQDALKTLGAIERMLMLYPDLLEQRRDRGLIYYQLDRFREARPDLEAYLSANPDAPDASIVRQVLDQIQSMM